MPEALDSSDADLLALDGVTTTVTTSQAAPRERAKDGKSPDYFRPGADDKITVAIARTHDDIAKALAIRAAVFLGEEDNITYNDEFDGNDMVATHLIAYVNGDPAGTFRIRWFADFARLERLGIRRRYRCLAVLNALVREARALCQQKGYRLASGKARADVVPFWRRFGAKINGEPVEMFRGTLVPLLFTFPPQANRQISSERLGEHEFEELISLPEGAWPEDCPIPSAHGSVVLGVRAHD